MAKVKFTAGRVTGHKCEAGKSQSFLWDSEAPGLGLRAASKGGKAYIFQGKLNGQAIRVTIGAPATWDIPAAQAEARRLKVIIDNGQDPRQVKSDAQAKARNDKANTAAVKDAAQAEAIRQSATIAEAWAVYLAHHAKRWGARHMADHINLSQTGGAPKKRGTGVTVQGVLLPLLQMRMVDISAKTLTAWQAKEAETRANNARQGFEMFRAFWRWCASRDEYATLINLQAVENKDLRAEVPSRKSKRFDVLQRAHMPSWFAAVRGLSNPVISAYLQALLLTGARREEMAALRWQDVDFQWNGLWVKDKIAEEGRKLPLTPYLSGLLAALPRRNEWVFSSPGAANGRLTEPRIQHNRALAVAGLEHVTLHGLRRTFASLAEWVEMPRGVVAQIMGHKPNATAEKHYINRPLELLAVWHGKYEAWILEQAQIDYVPVAPGLRVVAA
ncbi:MAG: tyrosine-type recombinase/integrase [Burkholderiaceae bacterium]